MSALERFIDNNDLTPDEEAFLWVQCSGADEYHDVERHLAWFRNEGPVPAREPVLPSGTGANASSGHSGSSTSEAAVRAEDADGRTADKQALALSWLQVPSTLMLDGATVRVSHYQGLTWKELDTFTGWGHGSTSRVLSDLHKAGRIARLTEERNRCKVYVLPEYVNGRETEPHGGRGRDRQFVSTETVSIEDPVSFQTRKVKVLVTQWKDGTMEVQLRADPDDRFSRWSDPVRLVEEEM
jgi:hypothetical protein